MTDRYYTVNLRHASIREICRYLSSPRDRVTAIINRLLGIDFFTDGCLADAETMRFWPADSRPKRMPHPVQAALDECAEKALAIHCFHSAAASDHLINYGAVLLPPDRRFWAQVVWAWSYKYAQLVVGPAIACTSVMPGGTLLTTTSAPRSLRAPSDFDVEYLSHATIGQVIQRHEMRLRSSSAAPIPVRDPVDAIRGAVSRKIQCHLSRRILVELDSNELLRMADNPLTADHGFCQTEPARPE